MALFAILHVQLEFWWLSLCVWMVRSHQARNAKLMQTDGCLSCLPLPACTLSGSHKFIGPSGAYCITETQPRYLRLEDEI